MNKIQNKYKKNNITKLSSYNSTRAITQSTSICPDTRDDNFILISFEELDKEFNGHNKVAKQKNTTVP